MKKALCIFAATICMLFLMSSCITSVPEPETTASGTSETSNSETSSSQTETSSDESDAVTTEEPTQASTTAAVAPDPAEMTIPEILQLFTLAASRVKTDKPGYTFTSKAHTEKGSIAITDNVPFHGFISDYVASAINKSETQEAKVSKGADHTDFPVKGQSWGSRPNLSALKKATAKDVGDAYELEFVFRDEQLRALPDNPMLTVHGKSFNLLSNQEFRDAFGGFNIRFLGINVRVDVERFEPLYTGSYIRCKINKADGRLLFAEYYLNTDADIETVVRVNKKEYVIGIRLEYSVSETYTFL